jgi:hypothetical protein
MFKFELGSTIPFIPHTTNCTPSTCSSSSLFLCGRECRPWAHHFTDEFSFILFLFFLSKLFSCLALLQTMICPAQPPHHHDVRPRSATTLQHRHHCGAWPCCTHVAALVPRHHDECRCVGAMSQATPHHTAPQVSVCMYQYAALKTPLTMHHHARSAKLRAFQPSPTPPCCCHSTAPRHQHACLTL